MGKYQTDKERVEVDLNNLEKQLNELDVQMKTLEDRKKTLENKKKTLENKKKKLENKVLEDLSSAISGAVEPFYCKLCCKFIQDMVSHNAKLHPTATLADATPEPNASHIVFNTKTSITHTVKMEEKKNKKK